MNTRRRSESAYIRQVHDIVMMYCTHEHVYMHKHLPSNVLAHRRLPMIMTSSITTACCGVTGVCGKKQRKRCWHFVHFFPTPISILNLTMSPESQENDVSKDILAERKYSQLFTHESNIFLLKQFVLEEMYPQYLSGELAQQQNSQLPLYILLLTPHDQISSTDNQENTRTRESTREHTRAARPLIIATSIYMLLTHNRHARQHVGQSEVH